MEQAETAPNDGVQAIRRGEKAKKPLTFKRLLALILKIIVVIHLGYILLTSSLILVYKFVNPPFTILMPYRALGYGWKLEKPKPLPLRKIPLYVRSMLISVEDGKFYSHHGLDFEAFKRAKEINDKLGKPLYGGSTLTMQVARTLFLVPEKSYVRKYFEIITALELEFILSKDRILELYFGYAEWGKGIFGIEAAARHWYGKGLASLTKDQAARLIALLSSPIKYSPETLYKSGILRERYAYLVRRYIENQSAPPDLAVTGAPPPGSPEPGMDESAVESAGKPQEVPAPLSDSLPVQPAPEQTSSPADTAKQAPSD
ncbi:MAG: transglycosylase domain-containing protein [Spirochaetia bacterium]|nr:transglycosylase domain-containing protein [Spirochaetia bacterium]